MRQLSVRRLCVLVGALAIVAALPLRAMAADDPKIDFAVGYSLLHDSDADGNFPMGWFVSVGKKVMPTISIVGDVSGNYKTITVEGIDAKLKVHTFMAGPRWSDRQGQITPWAQVLVGMANLSGSVFGITASETDLAIQPGGGIDYAMSSGIDLRFGGNLRFIRSSGEVGKEFQFVAGIVMRGR